MAYTLNGKPVTKEEFYAGMKDKKEKRDQEIKTDKSKGNIVQQVNDLLKKDTVSVPSTVPKKPEEKQTTIKPVDTAGTQFNITPTKSKVQVSPLIATPNTSINAWDNWGDSDWDKFDIQAEINRLKAINPNDSKIAFLNTKRDDKIRRLYGADPKAEISKRLKSNPNDPLIKDIQRVFNISPITENVKEAVKEMGQPTGVTGVLSNAGKLIGTMLKEGQAYMQNVPANDVPAQTPISNEPTKVVPKNQWETWTDVDWDKFDIQSEINRLKSINPNDPNIAFLTSKRDEKINRLYGSDPQTAVDNIAQRNSSDPLINDMQRLFNVRPSVKSAKNGLEDGNKVPSLPTDTEEAYNQLINQILGLTQKAQDFKYTPSETPEEYRKRMIDEINRLAENQQNTEMAAITKARGDITSEKNIATRDIESLYQKQLDNLAKEANSIRNVYSSGKRNIETEQSEKLPEFQSQQSQADVKAQKAARNIIDYFTRKGLGTGGQLASELGSIQAGNLAAQGDIATQEGAYMRDISNRLAGLEEEQASGLSDIERLKGEAGLSMAAGKKNIIERVNNALSGLDVDEKNLINSIASMKTQMESKIDPDYRDMTSREKEEQFNMMLKQIGVSSENLSAVKNIVDDIANIRATAAEQEYKSELAEIERQYKQGMLDLEERRIAVQEAQQKWDENPNNPANRRETRLGTESSTPKSTLSATQYYNTAIDKLNEKVPSGETDGKGKPIMVPKYNKDQFEDWLAGLPISDKEYDDIVAALDLDNYNWYVAPKPPFTGIGPIDFNQYNSQR